MRKIQVAAFLATVVLLSAWLLVFSTAQAATPAQQAGKPVVIYFFWGDGCPHCAAAKPFLTELSRRYPNVTIREFEVWNHPENRDPFLRMTAKYGLEPTAVPTIFIGDSYWVGYAETPYAQEIENVVAACAADGCPDAGAGIETPLSLAVPEPIVATAPMLTGGVAAPVANELSVPLLGAVDLGAHSLILSTTLIAFIDGFNPCSLWVLSVLLALTIHTGSRKKVFIIGAIFLTVTSLVYVLFIAGLFTMFTVLDWIPWIQVLVAAVALFFAIVNIKDYFWYKEGISLTIADEQKPSLYKSMRRVLNAGNSMPALIGAAIVMSAGASLVEFSCTAGFPMLWTNLLATREVTALTFALLLVLYMLIYQVDEMIIFGSAVVGLRASKLEEKQGRILKLFGGTLMLTLALVMLIDPSLMNNLPSTLWVFLIALGAALAILLVHRKVLPALGIYIGTELKPPIPQRGHRRNRHHHKSAV